MSKVYEAILKLEREAGGPLPGVSPDATENLHKAASEAVALGGRTDLSVAGEEPSSEDVKSLAATLKEEPQNGGPDRLLAPPQPSGEGRRVSDIPDTQREYVNITPETRLIYHTEPESSGADRFRLLRMRLTPLRESGKLKTIFVTSAKPKDGKSTVVLNLATALAEKGKRNVLVVEGDLYHPTLSAKLGIPEKAGLAECLERDEDPLKMLRRLDPLGWFLLAAGRAQGNPTELLQIPRLDKLFRQLAPLFDWIVIDTPPVLPLTDTLSLRRHADAGLMVVRADRTPAAAVEKAISTVGSKNLLGILLNGANELDRLYSDYRQSYRRKVSE